MKHITGKYFSKVFQGRIVRVAGISFSLAGILLLAPPARADDCHGQDDPFHLTSAGPWYRSFALKSGDRCVRKFAASRGLSDVIFQKVTLAQSPSFGTVALQANATTTYTSKPGYRGQDKYTLEICGRENGIAGCATVVYVVTVN